MLKSCAVVPGNQILGDRHGYSAFLFWGGSKVSSFFILGVLKMRIFKSNKDYHSFSEQNVCLARLQMELCRAANISAAR